jgi:hypothetical protein
MNNTKRLAAQVAGALAIATLVGTSAFAESRHSDATEHHDRSSHSQDHRDNRGSDHHNSNQSQSTNQAPSRRESRGSASQTYERHDSSRSSGQFNGSVQADSYRNRSYDRSQSNSYSNRSNDRYQAETYRNRGNDRSSSGYHNNRPEYDDRGRHSMSINGRVSRFVHESGGYRIWVAGGRYPVWIPEARISLFPRLRIGLSLNFGGYYDSRGYLEAYDYYDGGYYGGAAYSSGILRGVVETVDYRRGTLVLRDENSGAFVTTLIRDGRLETLRPGDFAEISGDWTRTGVFEGLRLEDVQGGRY